MKIKTSSQQVPISLSDLNSPQSIRNWMQDKLREFGRTNQEIKQALKTIIESESFRQRPEDVRKKFYDAINKLQKSLDIAEDPKKS